MKPMPRLWLWWIDAAWMPEWGPFGKVAWSLNSGGPVAWPWRVYCWLHRGHRVTDDHCMRPEHRYCVICGKATPNAEVAA